MAFDSIVNSIVKYFSGFDSAGKSNQTIDTYLEYNKLGEYLSGGRIKGCSKQYSELTVCEKNILQEIHGDLRDTFENTVSNNDELPEINLDNAMEYVEMWEELFYTNSNDLELIDKLERALYKYAYDNGFRDDSITYKKLNYSSVIGSIIDREQRMQLRKDMAANTLRLLENPYDQMRLKEAVDAYIKDNNTPALVLKENADVDLGNGKFDKSAKQKNNVCWAIASINSLLRTEQGKILLETNCYYDKTTGVFAIHLQEAEDNNLHGGIFIVTPEEIQNRGPALADGEGDVTAYLIAIEKYFDEIKQNPELAESISNQNRDVRDLSLGNYGFRFFELLTGGEYSEYKYADPFQAGIGTGCPNRLGGFDKIYEIVAKKNSAVTFAIGGHTVSVVDARDSKLIIQESNNDEAFPEMFSDKKRNHMIFKRVEDINGAPAYEISKYDFEGYVQAVSFLKW